MTASLITQPDTGIDPQEAVRHIKWGDDWRMLRLGARDLFYDETAGYVQFDVKITRKLRVVVKLAADDSYSVEVGRIKRKRGDIEYVVLAQETGLYADQLGPAVERLVVEQSAN